MARMLRSIYMMALITGKLKKILLTVIGIILFLWAGYFGGWWDMFLGRNRDLGLDSARLGKDLILQESHLVGWDNFEIVWEMDAEEIWQEMNGNMIYFKNIMNGAVYMDDDDVAYIAADTARWERLNRRLYVNGNIMVEIDEMTFFTEQLVVQYSDDKIFCPQPLTASSNDKTMIANSAELDWDKEVFILRGDVEFTLENDKCLAEGLLFYYKKDEFELIEPKEVLLEI